MRLKRVYIEIMNTCNLHCTFCVGNSRPAQVMDVITFREIAKQVRPYTDFLYLHVLGEPLMHPQLAEILAICAELGFQVNITTNGTLLAKRFDVLRQATALRQLNVSLHSFSQHDEINPDQYLKECFDIGEQLSDHVYMSYRLWNKQQGQLDKETMVLVDWINHRYDADIAPEGIVGSDKYTIQKHMYLNFEEQFVWPDVSHPFVDDPARCLGMKNMCAILVNGDVVPCCMDGNAQCKLGNIHETSFIDILHSKFVNQIRMGWSKQKAIAPLCQHCRYRLRFTASK